MFQSSKPTCEKQFSFLDSVKLIVPWFSKNFRCLNPTVYQYHLTDSASEQGWIAYRYVCMRRCVKNIIFFLNNIFLCYVLNCIIP